MIAGESQGVRGSVQREVTEPLYLDLHFGADPAQRFAHALPAGHNAFVCVYRGSVQIGEGDARHRSRRAAASRSSPTRATAWCCGRPPAAASRPARC